MSLFMPATLSVLQEGPAGEGASATLIGISAQGNFPEIRRSEVRKAGEGIFVRRFGESAGPAVRDQRFHPGPGKGPCT